MSANHYDASVRCPVCRELFVPTNGRVPTHYNDTHDGERRCAGSGHLAR